MENPLLKFFRDRRDDSIHAVPVTPVRKFTNVVAGFLNIGDDENEHIIPYPHNTTVDRYEFQDRPGEEVIELSQQYLKVLQDFVEEGVAKDCITG